VVLWVDEKPHIQVLERAQGWLRLPNGKALNGFSHCYKRHGTSTLFAALRNLSCTAIPQLRNAIDRFVQAYQKTAAPFE
jgi:hypothetical protein